MFSLFAKKAMNEEAAKSFWMWFAEKEEWVINCISNHDSAFIWAIDERLKPVFPYFKGELEFQLGYNANLMRLWKLCQIRMHNNWRRKDWTNGNLPPRWNTL